MIKIKVNVYPSGGYLFVEANGAHIRGSSWTAVISRVTEFRKVNRFPPGNPEAEVMTQACQRNPNLCYPENKVKVHPTPSLKGRVLKWLSQTVSKVKSGGLKLVGVEEAKKRSEICAQCSRNLLLPSGCSSCIAAVIEYRKTTMPHRKADARLGGCSILAEDNNSATNLDLVRISNPTLPAKCWRKAIL